MLRSAAGKDADLLVGAVHELLELLLSVLVYNLAVDLGLLRGLTAHNGHELLTSHADVFVVDLGLRNDVSIPCCVLSSLDVVSGDHSDSDVG
ncbi:MAG: hypothetical protein ACK56I_08680, partial [bacterium]